MQLGFPADLYATARRSDPETSHVAAAAFTPERLGRIMRDVLRFFRERRNATDEELEDALEAIHPAFSTLRKRRTELFQRGYLADTGLRRINRNHRPMVVWAITTAGRDFIDREQAA